MRRGKCIDCKFNILNTLGIYCDCKLLGCEDLHSLRKHKTDDFEEYTKNQLIKYQMKKRSGI